MMTNGLSGNPGEARCREPGGKGRKTVASAESRVDDVPESAAVFSPSAAPAAPGRQKLI